MTLDELSAAVEAASAEGESDTEPILPLVPLGDAARTMFPSLHLSEAEAGAFAHGQAPRRSRSELAQWAVEAGYCPKSAPEEEPAPIAAVAPDGTVLGLLRIDAARLRTVLVF